MGEDLYDMYRLKAGVNPFEFIETVRDEMRFVRDGLLAEAACELAVDMIDDADFDGQERPHAPLSFAFQAWGAIYSGSDPLGEKNDPYRFVYYLAPDATDPDRYLLLAHYRDEQMNCVFADMDEVEDYSWWPLDDMEGHFSDIAPEEVSEEEWNLRGAAWAPYWQHRLDPTGTMVEFRPTDTAGISSPAMSLREGDGSLAVRWAPGRNERARRLAMEFLNRRHPGSINDYDLISELADVIEPRLADVDAALLDHGAGQGDMEDLTESLSAVVAERIH